jgi:gamma-glutamylcyclotransferase (GGCT)/AIG2-like uncharacterized protein YtfP
LAQLMDAHLRYAYQTQPLSSRPTIKMTSANGHTAFFYGTLMAPRVLHRVCHGPSLPLSTTQNNQLIVRPALLKSFRRHRVLQADYPAILPSDDSTVRGTLVSGLTDGDIWRLDIFEGDEYERQKVKVRLLEDEGDVNVEPTEEQLSAELEAETYVWIAGKQHLEDREWDFEEFVREKMGRWVGVRAEEEGEYKGENIRPSILGRSMTPASPAESVCFADFQPEVDEAVKAQGGATDPTGGRSLDGKYGKAVEETRGKEKNVLESAV